MIPVESFSFCPSKNWIMMRKITFVIKSCIETKHRYKIKAKKMKKREDCIQSTFMECRLCTNHWASPLEIYTTCRCMVDCPSLLSFFCLISLPNSSSVSHRVRQRVGRDERGVWKVLFDWYSSDGLSVLSGEHFGGLLIYLQRNSPGVLLTWAGIFWLANFKCPSSDSSGLPAAYPLS